MGAQSDNRLVAVVPLAACLVLTLAVGCTSPSDRGKRMTKDEARRMIKSLLESVGDRDGLWTSGSEGFGNLLFATRESRDSAQILFTYEDESLVCRALLSELRAEPRPGELEGFREEERAGAPTGGGKFEYTAADRGLHLTRAYKEPVDSKAFIDDMQKLAEAAIHWQDEVSERVYDRLFGRSPKAASPTPDRPR